MMPVRDSIIIIAAFIIGFFLKGNTHIEILLPLIGILTFGYIITSFLRRKTNKDPKSLTAPFNMFCLILLILLLIQLTGGFGSLLFYSLAFVSFAVVFVFVPETVFVLCLAVILFFLPDIYIGDFWTNLVRLAIPVALSPLAYFIGKAATESQAEQQTIDDLEKASRETSEQILKDANALLTTESEKLPIDELAKLKDIVIKAEDMKEATS